MAYAPRSVPKPLAAAVPQYEVAKPLEMDEAVRVADADVAAPTPQPLVY